MSLAKKSRQAVIAASRNVDRLLVMSGFPARPEFDRAAPGAQGANLSGREREILVLVIEGLCNKEIARRLSIGPETVKSHLKRVFGKLTVRTRAAAAYRALAQRLV